MDDERGDAIEEVEMREAERSLHACQSYHYSTRLGNNLSLS